MSASPTHPSISPERALPAWVFSIAFHATAFALLCAAIRPMEHGAADALPGSIGLVLHRASADGAESAGDQYPVRQTVAVAEELAAPNLLAATTNDEPQPAPANTGEDSAKTSKPSGAAAGATKSSKQSKPSGKTSARPNFSGGRTGSSGGTGYAQVSVFGVQGRGSKFIYVFDRSSSMEGPPLASAKKQLIDSLQSLESVHQFHVIFFNTKTQSLDIAGGGRRIAFASDRNKKLAANFIGGITADGGTDRMYALREAISFAPDVIFFLTDADDPMSPSELAEIARANRKAQAAICVIEFGKKPSPATNNFLARLAHDNGGQYGYVDTTRLEQQSKK